MLPFAVKENAIVTGSQTVKLTDKECSEYVLAILKNTVRCLVWDHLSLGYYPSNIGSVPTKKLQDLSSAEIVALVNKSADLICEEMIILSPRDSNLLRGMRAMKDFNLASIMSLLEKEIAEYIISCKQVDSNSGNNSKPMKKKEFEVVPYQIDPEVLQDPHFMAYSVSMDLGKSLNITFEKSVGVEADHTLNLAAYMYQNHNVIVSGFLSVDQVRDICPKCADSMITKGLPFMSATVLEKAIMNQAKSDLSKVPDRWVRYLEDNDPEILWNLQKANPDVDCLSTYKGIDYVYKQMFSIPSDVEWSHDLYKGQVEAIAAVFDLDDIYGRDILEKAIKNLSKLQKITKTVNKKGVSFTQTYYIDPDKNLRLHDLGSSAHKDHKHDLLGRLLEDLNSLDDGMHIINGVPVMKVARDKSDLSKGYVYAIPKFDGGFEPIGDSGKMAQRVFDISKSPELVAKYHKYLMSAIPEHGESEKTKIEAAEKELADMPSRRGKPTIENQRRRAELKSIIYGHEYNRPEKKIAPVIDIATKRKPGRPRKEPTLPEQHQAVIDHLKAKGGSATFVNKQDIAGDDHKYAHHKTIGRMIKDGLIEVTDKNQHDSGVGTIYSVKLSDPSKINANIKGKPVVTAPNVLTGKEPDLSKPNMPKTKPITTSTVATSNAPESAITKPDVVDKTIYDRAYAIIDGLKEDEKWGAIVPGNRKSNKSRFGIHRLKNIGDAKRYIIYDVEAGISKDIHSRSGAARYISESYDAKKNGGLIPGSRGMTEEETKIINGPQTMSLDSDLINDIASGKAKQKVEIGKDDEGKPIYNVQNYYSYRGSDIARKGNYIYLTLHDLSDKRKREKILVRSDNLNNAVIHALYLADHYGKQGRKAELEAKDLAEREADKNKNTIPESVESSAISEQIKKDVRSKVQQRPLFDRGKEGILDLTDKRTGKAPIPIRKPGNLTQAEEQQLADARAKRHPVLANLDSVFSEEKEKQIARGGDDWNAVNHAKLVKEALEQHNPTLKNLALIDEDSTLGGDDHVDAVVGRIKHEELDDVGNRDRSIQHITSEDAVDATADHVKDYLHDRMGSYDVIGGKKTKDITRRGVLGSEFEKDIRDGLGDGLVNAAYGLNDRLEEDLPDIKHPSFEEEVNKKIGLSDYEELLNNDAKYEDSESAKELYDVNNKHAELARTLHEITGRDDMKEIADKIDKYNAELKPLTKEDATYNFNDPKTLHELSQIADKHGLHTLSSFLDTHRTIASKIASVADTRTKNLFEDVGDDEYVKPTIEGGKITGGPKREVKVTSTKMMPESTKETEALRELNRDLEAKGKMSPIPQGQLGNRVIAGSTVKPATVKPATLTPETIKNITNINKVVEDAIKESAKSNLPALKQEFNDLHRKYQDNGRSKRGKRSVADIKRHNELINELKLHGINVQGGTLGSHQGLDVGSVSATSVSQETKAKPKPKDKYIPGVRRDVILVKDDKDDNNGNSGNSGVDVEHTKTEGVWSVVRGDGDEHHVVHAPTGISVATFPSKDDAHAALDAHIASNSAHRNIGRDLKQGAPGGVIKAMLGPHAKALKGYAKPAEVKAEIKEEMNKPEDHTEFMDTEGNEQKVKHSKKIGNWSVVDHGSKSHIVHVPSGLIMSSHPTKDDAHNILDKFLEKHPESKEYGSHLTGDYEPTSKDMEDLGNHSGRLEKVIDEHVEMKSKNEPKHEAKAKEILGEKKYNRLKDDGYFVTPRSPLKAEHNTMKSVLGEAHGDAMKESGLTFHKGYDPESDPRDMNSIRDGLDSAIRAGKSDRGNKIKFGNGYIEPEDDNHSRYSVYYEGKKIAENLDDYDAAKKMSELHIGAK